MHIAVFPVAKLLPARLNRLNLSFFAYAIVAAIVLSSMSFSASAATFYLKPGQSRTIQSNEPIGTVFISNSNIADYKVIGETSIAVYAKGRGYADLIVYSRDDKILLTHSIDVDPVVPDLHNRIKKEFPGSDIRITSIIASGTNKDKASYLLSGTATDDLTRDRIYALVGSSLVGDSDTIERSFKYGSDSNSSDVFFLYNRQYENIINKIEVTKDNQVNVKLTLVEVSKKFTDSLGIEWQNLTLGSIVGGGTAVSSVGTFNLLGLKNGFDINNVVTIIHAVQNDELAKVLAEPNLTVLSGETAEFLVGGEIPIVTRGASKDDSATVTYKDYGIKLSVGAKIANEQIRLFISNEFSSLSGTYAFNDYQIPTLSTRRTRSTIELKDGDSFIISGLLSEQDVESLTKIPFLGDIPILGALARSTTTSRNKTELVVFCNREIS